MIRIRRRSRPPSGLKKAARIENRKNIALHGQGQLKLVFDRRIYTADVVKDVLEKSQHRKCCYCEKSTADWHGDVEHYRPKGGVTIRGKLRQPGYFWLAYDWDNLLWACNICNRSRKKNHFPIANEAGRATATGRSTAMETPLLINPLTDDPSQYLGFRGESPYSINGNAMGNATIKTTGLDRPDLNEKRFDLLNMVKTLVGILEVARGSEPAAKASIILKRHLSDRGEFSSCVRHFLLDNWGTIDVDTI